MNSLSKLYVLLFTFVVILSPAKSIAQTQMILPNVARVLPKWPPPFPNCYDDSIGCPLYIIDEASYSSGPNFDGGEITGCYETNENGHALVNFDFIFNQNSVSIPGLNYSDLAIRLFAYGDSMVPLDIISWEDSLNPNAIINIAHNPGDWLPVIYPKTGSTEWFGNILVAVDHHLSQGGFISIHMEVGYDQGGSQNYVSLGTQTDVMNGSFCFDTGGSNPLRQSKEIILSNSDYIKVYPNPIKDKIKLIIRESEVTPIRRKEVTLTIFNINGEVVFYRKNNSAFENGLETLHIKNVDHLKSGVYLLKISSRNRNYFHKITKI